MASRIKNLYIKWIKDTENKYRCWTCNKIMLDWKPTYCCDGFECGCRGEPTEPQVCSNYCFIMLAGTEEEKEHMKNGTYDKYLEEKEKMWNCTWVNNIDPF